MSFLIGKKRILYGIYIKVGNIGKVTGILDEMEGWKKTFSYENFSSRFTTKIQTTFAVMKNAFQNL